MDKGTKQQLIVAMTCKATLHALLVCVVVQGAADNGKLGPWQHGPSWDHKRVLQHSAMAV